MKKSLDAYLPAVIDIDAWLCRSLLQPHPLKGVPCVVTVVFVDGGMVDAGGGDALEGVDKVGQIIA